MLFCENQRPSHREEDVSVVSFYFASSGMQQPREVDGESRIAGCHGRESTAVLDSSLSV